jgi:protein-S-isoprenylcysteine O-methyltransferase Ste14
VVLAVLLNACWLVFAAVWVVGWIINLWRAPNVRRREWKGSPTTAVLVLLVVLARVVPQDVFRPLTYRATWLDVIGLVLLVASTAFTVWARVWLGTMWTSDPALKERHQLRTDGPYAVTRNPIYTGLLGMLLATAILNGLGFWLVVLVVCVLFFELKMRGEERLLSAEFGDKYEQFCRRVPRLLPGRRSRLVLGRADRHGRDAPRADDPGVRG